MLVYALEYADDNEACDRNLQGFLDTAESTKSLPPSSIWPNSNKDDVDVFHEAAQGARKFGFYKFFKKYYSDLAGPDQGPVQTQLGFARGLSDGLPKFVRSEGALG
ncbi:hypothetical protein ACFX2J_021296 [Malus domestica]